MGGMGRVINSAGCSLALLQGAGWPHGLFLALGSGTPAQHGRTGNHDYRRPRHETHEY